MRLKKVILVQPNLSYQQRSGGWGFNPPMGLAYIAAMLEKDEVNVEILDANVLRFSPRQVADYAVEKKADIVGVSVMTPAYPFAVELANLLPDNILSIAGGPHPTNLPYDMLKEGFKLVVKGEGEITMRDIVRDKNRKDIKGISYLDSSGKLTETLPAEPVDIDELPFPARHLLISYGVNRPYFSAGTQYLPWAPILSSRGCPYGCYYCDKHVFGYKPRMRKVENVAEEIGMLVNKYGIKEIDFCDDCFNFDLERAEKILDILKDMHLHIRFSNGLRVDKLSRRFLEKMKESGCDYIAFGIESGDQGILDKIPKKITIPEVRKAVNIAKELKMITTGFFMVGLLEDTQETMQRTIDFAKELDLDYVFFNMTVPYPGTMLWKVVNEKGKILINNWNDFYHTSNRMSYRIEGTAPPEVVEKMYRKAYRDYYFRWSYVMKLLKRLFKPGQLKIAYRGFLRWLFTQRATI